jgi:hypothetical protein
VVVSQVVALGGGRAGFDVIEHRFCLHALGRQRSGERALIV